MSGVPADNLRKGTAWQGRAVALSSRTGRASRPTTPVGVPPGKGEPPRIGIPPGEGLCGSIRSLA
jgi:hypothetical protein